MRRRIIVFILLVIILAVGGFLLFSKGDDSPSGSSKTQSKFKNPSGLNKDEVAKYTIDNPASIYYIVNKKRAVSSTYVPDNLVTLNGAQLRADTANALNQLISAAGDDGVNIKILSGYRSYTYQTQVYNNYVKKDGRAKADTYSARPGHSEHQTGLAADLGGSSCDLQICFGDTQAGQWLAEHAHEYGFIIRYPKGKERLTGYQYEPWHVRYMGIDLATKIYKSGKTMEQFFGVPFATTY